MPTWTILQKDTDTVIATGREEDGSVLLLEDNWYFSPDAVEMAHLKLTDRTYTCPYKGICFWLDLDAPGVKARNIAWVYQQPKPGYEQIKDRIAFYTRETLGTVPVVLPDEATAS